MTTGEGPHLRTIDAYLEGCYTDTILTAANLRQSLFNARGTPENSLLAFYDVFYQLWQLTRFRLVTKRAEDGKGLDEKVALWFSHNMKKESDRKRISIECAKTGLELAESWIEVLNKSGIVGIR